MPARHPLCWLMTDERLGERLWPALFRLPPGSGVVFRHYSLPPAERRALFRGVRRVARARRLLLSVARPKGLGLGDGVHGVAGRRALTWPAHDRAQAVAGARAGAALFVSPVFPTRSHSGAAALGIARAAAMARGLRVPKVALGGMTPARFRRLRKLGFAGWAAIDGLSGTLGKAGT